MLTVGGLFSGIGGIEFGLERTGGFRTIWQSEIDDYASAVLRKHWPRVPNIGDITRIDWTKVEKPDLICGGFPCQDISNAGKKAGIKEGTRSGLWFEFHKAIRSLRPDYALIENVSAITQSGLDIVLSGLAEIGYDAEWFTLSAQEVGAWHKRERLFIVAYPKCDLHLNKVARLNGATQNLEDVIREEDSPTRESCGTGDVRTSDEEHVPDSDSPRLEERRKPKPTKEKHYSAECNSQNISDSESKRLDGGICENNKDRDWGVLKREEDEWVSLRSKVAGCHKTRNQETYWAAEPDVGRVADGIPSRVDRIKCLGNAVVPQVAQVIGQAILEINGGAGPEPREGMNP